MELGHRIIFSPYSISTDMNDNGNFTAVCDVVHYRSNVIRGQRSPGFILQNKILFLLLVVYTVISGIYVFKIHLNEFLTRRKSKIRRKKHDRSIIRSNPSSPIATGTMTAMSTSNGTINLKGSNIASSQPVWRRKRIISSKTTTSLTGEHFFGVYRLLFFGLGSSVISLLMSTIVFIRHIYIMSCTLQFAIYVTFPMVFTIPFILEALATLNSCHMQNRAQVMSIEELAQQRKKISQQNIFQKLKLALFVSTCTSNKCPPRIKSTNAITSSDSVISGHESKRYDESDFVLFDFSNDFGTLILLSILIISPVAMLATGLFLSMPVVQQRCSDCETYAEIVITISFGNLGALIYSFFLLYKLRKENDLHFRTLRFAFISVLLILAASSILFFLDPGNLDLHYIISWEALSIFAMVFAYTVVYVFPVFGIVLFCSFDSVNGNQEKYKNLYDWLQNTWKKIGNHRRNDSESSTKTIPSPTFVREEIFSDVLSDPELKYDFETFVNESFIYELWRFRCEAIEWKKNYNRNTVQERIEKLLAIHEALVAVGSPFEINVSEDLRCEFEKKLIECNIIGEDKNPFEVLHPNADCSENILDSLLGEVTKMLLDNINSRFIGDVRSGRMSIIASTRTTTLTTQSLYPAAIDLKQRSTKATVTDVESGISQSKRGVTDFGVEI